MKAIVMTCIAMIGTAVCELAAADVWEFRRDGSTVFHQTLDFYQRSRMTSDWRPPTAAVLRARRAKYDSVLRQIASEQRVDPLLMHALIEIESAYDPFAVSTKGAVGMMQLMPPTADRFGVSDSKNAVANMRGGAKYLAFLNELFDGETRFVVAAYHAGEGRVAPCVGQVSNDCKRGKPRVPDIPETKRHVRLVLAALDRRLEAAARAGGGATAHSAGDGT